MYIHLGVVTPLKSHTSEFYFSSFLGKVVERTYLEEDLTLPELLKNTFPISN